MQVVIDLIASTVIFGWLFIIGLTTKTANSEDLQTNQGELLCQENLVEVTKLLEYDFRKIGYCKEPDKIPNPTLAIHLADSSKIRFLTDLDLNGSGPDGNLDSITYYLGPPGTMPNNPNTCILYRVVNNLNAYGSNLGVTSFRLTYYDQNNKVIATPVRADSLQFIFSIQISISVQNVVASALQETAPINQQFQTAFYMQRRLATVNYLNR